MKHSYWDVVKQVIAHADIILYLLDSRFPSQSVNAQIIEMIKNRGKKLIYVLTKADLKSASSEKLMVKPIVPVSSKHKTGFGRLRTELKIAAKTVKYPTPRIGVLGYPNVGKSSLINVLKKSKSASVSPLPGHTRGMQYLRVGQYLFLDTPGVIPKSKQKDPHALKLGAVRSDDPEEAALSLITQLPSIADYFDVTPSDDEEETLEEIAIVLKFLKKGGKPDTRRAADHIIKLHQQEKFSE